MCGWGEGQVCGLKPVLRAWKPLRGWGVWVEGVCGLMEIEK